MDPSPKHPSLPCLGSKRLSTPFSLVLPPSSTMENPPFPEAHSSSTSSVLPPTPSLQDRHLPSPHIVSSAGVSSILNANDSIECSNGSTKRGHCSSIPKLVLNNAFNQARTGHSTLNRAVVAEVKGVLSSSPQTSTIAANLGNNGGHEDSSFAAHLKNELGKMKGPMDQCNKSEKPALDVHRPDQLHQVPLSSFGMVEKPASKGEACPSAIVEDQKVQLEEVSSLSNYVLPYNKGISFTPHLVNKDASNAIGQVPPIISEKSHISYSNVLKGAHHNPLMDPPSSRPMNLKYYQPFHSGNRNYNIAMRIWGNRGLLEVLANEKGFYFFKFSDDEACSNVLEASHWLFAGRMVILKKWHLRLILSKDSYSKIPVWVKLFNIPHEYWNEEGLSHIASAIGKPLYANSLTESMKRISFARVCIEIDTSCDIVDSFDLFMGDSSNPKLRENVEILVEYQWKPKICTECKSFGHSITNCPKLKPLLSPSENVSAPKQNKNGGESINEMIPRFALPKHAWNLLHLAP
ncbi:hypothetical protein Dsin_001882 [Dipteronia sinensis]|uniref:DUF4283 domain-containing protein n=1 Tax=Dipteronia sinensis TaxID=43782 RepID=A0AAE0EIW3_9ROSI|nr:hypothetical protein Dsin_001882 [Dipteronia sinensis]